MKVAAVVGASRDRNKFGNRAIRHLQEQGYTVVPINRHEATIEGLVAYPALRDVPVGIDLVTIYVPPDQAEAVLDEIAALQIPEVWINPGADSPRVIARARALGIEPIVACTLVELRPPAGGRPPSRVVDRWNGRPYTQKAP